MTFVTDACRLKIIKFLSNGGIGLNVGCGNTRFDNKINIDVRKSKRGKPLDVDELASVLSLPYGDNYFEEIIFSEVLEHLHDGEEVAAFKEMKRVLKPNGQLIMTVPNGGLIHKIIDPFWWIGESPLTFHHSRKHRHYEMKHIISLAHASGFYVKVMFTAGRIPWGSPIIWAINHLIGEFKKESVVNAFKGSIGDKGGVLFALLVKPEAC